MNKEVKITADKNIKDFGYLAYLLATYQNKSFITSTMPANLEQIRNLIKEVNK